MKNNLFALSCLLFGGFSMLHGQSAARADAEMKSLLITEAGIDTPGKVHTACNDSEKIKPGTEKEDDEEGEQPWSVSSAVHYYSRYTCFGVDLSEDRPAFSVESEIGHECGWSAGFEVFALTGTNGGYEHSALHAGYEYPLNTSIIFTGTYTYYSYETDTLSVLDGISNTIALGGTFKAGGFLFSASFTAFFGGGMADYAAAGVSTNYTIGQLIIEPSVQLCFASQTVSDSLLPKNRGKGKGVKNGTASALTTTITGMSNFTFCLAFRCPLGKGFSASVMPSYVYSPTDLAVSRSQFIVTVGLEHSIDF